MANLDQIMDYLADYTTAEEITPSITSTTGTLDSAKIYKRGKEVTLKITAKPNSTTTVGGNMYVGQLNDSSLYPAIYAQTIGMYSQASIVIQMTETGMIVFRVSSGSVSSGNAVMGALHYMIA